MNIQVSFESGKAIGYIMPLTSTIKDLKARISREMNLQPEIVQIFYESNLLEESISCACFTTFGPSKIILKCKITRSHSTFTKDEEDSLFGFWMIYRNNWTKIQSFMPYKSADTLSNHWNTILLPRLIQEHKLNPYEIEKLINEVPSSNQEKTQVYSQPIIQTDYTPQDQMYQKQSYFIPSAQELEQYQKQLHFLNDLDFTLQKKNKLQYTGTMKLEFRLLVTTS